MRRFLHRPSPAMIVACMALLVALSGNAVADQVNAVIAKLKNNSVTSATVKNGSLKLADFNAKEAAKLKGAAGPAGPVGAAGAPGPQGPAGTPNGYSKTEVDAGFLAKAGKAADADKLDGIDSTGFVQGAGALGSNYALQSVGANDTAFFDIPKIGKIEVSCSTGPAYTLKFTNDSGGTVRYSSRLTDVSQTSGDDTVGESDQVVNGATKSFITGGSDLRDLALQFERQTGTIFSGFTTYTGTVHLMADGAPIGDATKCKVQGEAQSVTTTSGGFILLPF